MPYFPVLFLSLIIFCLIGPDVSKAQEITEETKKQLRELKALCDEELIAPDLCIEKQRAILGLDTPQAAPASPCAAAAAQANAVTTTGAKQAAQLASTPPRTYESDLGFKVSLSRGWQTFNRDLIKSSFAKMKGRLKGQLRDDPKTNDALEKLSNRALASKIEVFQRDRMQIHVQPDTLKLYPDLSNRLDVCKRLLAEPSKIGYRSLTTYSCLPTEVQGLEALYLDRDSSIPAMRSLLYVVRRESGEVLQFIGHCQKDYLNECHENLESFMRGVEWVPPNQVADAPTSTEASAGDSGQDK